MISSFNSRVLDELRKLVLEEHDNVITIISRGGGIDDFPAYKQQVGQLFAYRRVIELFDEAVEKVEKSE